MKKILLVFLLLYTVLFFSSSVSAQRLECDECGYCIGREAPESWESCRACIYEGSSKDPGSNETLQATKTPGRYYTQLGCLNTEAESFTDPTAQGGLLNFLLSRLLFPIVGTLSFLSLMYGAFLLMTAQGSSEQVGRGKSYIVGAIVGLIFTLSAVLIINIIAGDILRIPGFTRTPQAEIAVKGTTAIANGITKYPILGVAYNGQELQSITLDATNQNIKINIPVSKNDLSKSEVLNNIVIKMKNDECYTRIANRPGGPTCCDPEIAHTKPVCANPNYDGDVNIRVNSILINGKKCTSYTKNGAPTTTKPISISSTGTSIRCSSIAN